MKPLYLKIALLLFLPTWLQAQVDIRFTPTGPVSGSGQLWEVTLTNTGMESHNVSIKAIIRSNTKGIQYIGQSNIVHLPPGTKVVTSQLVLPIQEQMNRLETDQLPPGDYFFIYTVTAYETNVRLAEKTEKVTVVPPPPEVVEKRSKKKKEKKPEPAIAKKTEPEKTEQQPKEKSEKEPKVKLPKPPKKAPLVQFSGYGRLHAQYANRQATGSQVPPSFLRGELYPTLTIGTVPIGASMMYSTEQVNYRQPINQINLHFDPYQFQQNLKDKLAEKLQALQNSANPEDLLKVSNFRDKLMEREFPKLDEWKAQLEDTDLQEKLKEIEPLQNLEEVLKSKAFVDAQKELARLQSQYNISSEEELEAKKYNLTAEQYETLKQAYAFQKEYEKLKIKKEDLEAKAKKLKKYQALANKIKAAESADANRLLTRAKDLKGGLKAFDLNSGAVKLFSSIRNMGAGTVYPYYSRQTINGVSVNGFEVELNPGGIVYLAAVHGKTTRQTFDTTRVLPRYSFPQKMTAAKAGIGDPFKSHLFVHYIHVEDDAETPFINNSENIMRYPEENHVVGTDLQLSLFQGAFVLGGEVNGSIYNRDKTAPNSLSEFLEGESIPFKSFFEENLNATSAVDYAYRGHLDVRLFKGATNVRGFYSRVGPGYTSLAAPTLIRDMRRWKGEFRQSLLSNKIHLSAWAGQDVNQLTPLSSLYQTQVFSYGGTFRVQLPGAPFFIVTYAPYQQESLNMATNSDINNESTMLNAIVGYNYRVGEKSYFNTQLSFVRQQFETTLANSSYSTNIFMLTQSATFGSLFTLVLNGSYQPELQIGNVTKKVLAMDVSGNATLFQKWTNSFGFQLLSHSKTDRRTGFYLRSIYPLTSFANLEMRVQRNIYDAPLDINGYQEFMGYLLVTFRW